MCNLMSYDNNREINFNKPPYVEQRMSYFRPEPMSREPPSLIRIPENFEHWSSIMGQNPKKSHFAHGFVHHSQNLHHRDKRERNGRLINHGQFPHQFSQQPRIPKQSHFKNQETNVNSSSSVPEFLRKFSLPSCTSMLQRYRRTHSADTLPAIARPNTFPSYFLKGSLIELGPGKLKRVEDMTTDDFLDCTNQSSDLTIDSSTVVKIIEKQSSVVICFSLGPKIPQVTIEAPHEHPFYVFGLGWSSCSPKKSADLFGLDCKKLTVGDICIALKHKQQSEMSAHKLPVSCERVSIS